MDTDIDDILREVDPTFHAIPQEKRDLQELTRAWIAERSVPELLPYAPPRLKPSSSLPSPTPTNPPSPYPAGQQTASLSASTTTSNTRSKKSRR
jgi:hypothetical protein